MKKRFLKPIAWLLTFAMLMTFIPGFTLTASAVEATSGTYTVTVTNDGNGTGTASIASGVSGSEVTLTATPNGGYKFKEWQVVSGGVTVTDNKFIIGTANVEIKAVFEETPVVPTPYLLWVGGVQVTSANASDIDGNSKAVFDAQSGTLTLNNYTYSGKGSPFIDGRTGEEYTAAIYAEIPLTIVLTGENTFTNTASAGDSIATIENLEIKGGGTLNLNADFNGFHGVYQRNNIKSVSLNGVTVNITANNSGIYSYCGSVSITDSNVDIDSEYAGIYSYRADTTIKNSDVDIKASQEEGIWTAVGGNINIENSNLTSLSGVQALYAATGDIVIDSELGIEAGDSADSKTEKNEYTDELYVRIYRKPIVKVTDSKGNVIPMDGTGVLTVGETYTVTGKNCNITRARWDAVGSNGSPLPIISNIVLDFSNNLYRTVCKYIAMNNSTLDKVVLIYAQDDVSKSCEFDIHADLYKVEISNSTINGNVTPDLIEALEGEEVTLTITPDTDYVFESVSAVDANGRAVTIENNKFTMPAGDVTVSAVFKSTAPDAPDAENTTSVIGVVCGETEGHSKDFCWDGRFCTNSAAGAYRNAKGKWAWDVTVSMKEYYNYLETYVNTLTGVKHKLADEIEIPETMTVTGVWNEALGMWEFGCQKYDMLCPVITVADSKGNVIPMDGSGVLTVGEKYTLNGRNCELTEVVWSAVDRSEGAGIDVIEGNEFDFDKEEYKRFVGTMMQHGLDFESVALSYYQDGEFKSYGFYIKVERYSVNISDSITNGNVTVDPEKYFYEESVFLWITADTGYKLKALIVDGTDVTNQVIHDIYAFSMPKKDVTVEAIFVEKEDIEIDETVQKLVYDGTAKAFEIKGDVTDGFTVKYQQEGVEVTPVNAGVYDVIVTRNEDSNYREADILISGGLVIEKAVPQVTEPTRFTNLAYNKNPQELISAGTVVGGTMQYKLDDGGWSTEIPKATDVGFYTVSYRVVGDSNHKDMNPMNMAVVIAPGKAITKKPVAKTNLIYDGQQQELIAAGNTAENMYMEYVLGSDTTAPAGAADWGRFVPKMTDAGTYYVWYKSGGENVNYVNAPPECIEVTIEKAQAVITLDNDAPVVATYGEAVLLPTATSNFGTVTVDKTTADMVNAGNYTVTYSVAETANYRSATKQISVTINPKDITGATVGVFDSLIYNGQAHVPSATVTIDNLTVTGVWSSVTNVTDTTTFTANGNFTGEIGNVATGMQKADPTFTAPVVKTELVYNGTAQELLTPGTAEGGTMKYFIGGMQASETVSKGTAAGEYTVNCIIVGDENHNNMLVGEYNVTIAKKSIQDATVSLDGTLTYNGQELTQNVTVTLDSFTVTYDVTDNKQTDVKTDGNYTLKVTANGNFEGEKTLEWNILKALPVQSTEKVTSAKVNKGKVLDDATVTEGEFLAVDGTVLGGSFAWVDGTEKITSDTVKQMTFTPNSTNYEAVTFDVMVDAKTINYRPVSSLPNYSGNKTGTTPDEEREETETKPEENPDGTETNPEENTDGTETKPEDNPDDIETNPDESTEAKVFEDVHDENHWATEDVDYVYENGLMKGESETEFSPDGAVMRAMLVTVLYRLENEPATNRSIPFADVDMGAYYANAVSWAKQNGIVLGYSETEFRPDERITREQIAAILFRYVQYKGMDAVTMEENLHFADSDEISPYAVSAMNWAVGCGLIKGKTATTINPKDNATRAEIAAILHRFIENIK